MEEELASVKQYLIQPETKAEEETEYDGHERSDRSV
jgi:hypothetical protein